MAKLFILIVLKLIIGFTSTHELFLIFFYMLEIFYKQEKSALALYLKMFTVYDLKVQ